MRPQLEIQAAHDRLLAIALKEVPNPFPADAKLEASLAGAANVLCWVLEHDHNEEFARILRAIDEGLAKRGLVLERPNN